MSVAVAERTGQEQVRARPSAAQLEELFEVATGLGADLDLPAVLDRLVLGAMRLTAARYGALAVLGPDGMIGDFVAHGFDAATRHAIGQPPQGRGLLGVLVEDPRPLRVDDVAAHPRAYGFPPHHPPLRAFLAVPVTTPAGIWGHLYVAEPERSGRDVFDAADEALVVSLAAAAGPTIANAQQHQRSARRQAWLEALTEVQEVMLTSTDRTSALRLVARRAREVADADFAALLLPAQDDELSVEVVSGDGMDEGPSLRFPLAGSLTGEVLRTGRPVVSDDVHADEIAFSPAGGWPEEWPQLGAALFVPLTSSSGTLGVLVVAARRDVDGRFGLGEVQLVGSLAGQAALALERLRARDDRARLAVYEDRDRIARDLHDLVIQRLFATGLQLQGTARALADEAQRARVERAVDDLDTTIQAIRATIFQLGRRAGALSAEVRAVVEESGRSLASAPVLTLEGPLDGGVPERVRPHLVAVLREALTNVARHAKADTASVLVAVGDDIRVVVEDDGCGMGVTVRRSGLRNLRERAESLGGVLEVSPADERGTRLEWRVPLRG
ncbi:MAG: GAF domain-containing protein [Motilibacteraceae bacterium]